MKTKTIIRTTILRTGRPLGPRVVIWIDVSKICSIEEMRNHLVVYMEGGHAHVIYASESGQELLLAWKNLRDPVE